MVVAIITVVANIYYETKAFVHLENFEHLEYLEYLEHLEHRSNSAGSF